MMENKLHIFTEVPNQYDIGEIHLNGETLEIPLTPFYLMFAVVKGQVEVYDENEIMTIPADCFAVLDKTKKYLLKPNNKKTVTIFYLKLNPQYVDLNLFTQYPVLNLWSTNNIKQYEFITCAFTLAENNLGNTISSLLKSMQHSELTHAVTKKINASQIGKELIFTQIHLNESISKIPAKSRRVAKDIFLRLLKSKLHILNNIKKPLHLNQMAIMANISEAHFSRNFKLVFKVPPLQYQIQRRIDKAAELLRRTNLSISEIYASTGFNNLSTFSRSFKKVYGIGPKEYRSYNNIYINSK